MPLSLVDEIHLIVSLCAGILPLVPKTELVSFVDDHSNIS